MPLNPEEAEESKGFQIGDQIVRLPSCEATEARHSSFSPADESADLSIRRPELMITVVAFQTRTSAPDRIVSIVAAATGLRKDLTPVRYVPGACSFHGLRMNPAMRAKENALSATTVANALIPAPVRASMEVFSNGGLLHQRPHLRQQDPTGAYDLMSFCPDYREGNL